MCIFIYISLYFADINDTTCWLALLVLRGEANPEPNLENGNGDDDIDEHHLTRSAHKLHSTFNARTVLCF